MFLKTVLADGKAEQQVIREMKQRAAAARSDIEKTVAVYPKLADFGGAGALVPITGFANSVAAPAIEFQKEGQVYGIGCKIFTIAGPVILYGIFTSWVAGVIYWFGGMLGLW